jgi:hypothetical protein
MLTRYLPFVLALLATNAFSAPPQVFESTCSGAKFRVTAVNNGHPLDNTYVLSAVTATGARELFKGEIGGWFHAACIAAKDGKSILLFQSYCGGSGCLEGKYGAVEPFSLKVVLRPSRKNVENHKQASALLGSAAPHLGNYKGTFCCGE